MVNMYYKESARGPGSASAGPTTNPSINLRAHKGKFTGGNMARYGECDPDGVELREIRGDLEHGLQQATKT